MSVTVKRKTMKNNKSKGFCKLPKNVQKKISPKNAAKCAQLTGFGKARRPNK